MGGRRRRRGRASLVTLNREDCARMRKLRSQKKERLQADISALTEQEAKGLLLQMAEREPGLLFDIMRQNTPRTVGSAVAPNWSLSRNDQRCRTIMLQHAA
ncbi:hypothetical protein LSAT2_018640 [Lamellibrachia satsuma]|nr:hypothetical protein LSAT2_018640 [Lamellibrachia satsuma]